MQRTVQADFGGAPQFVVVGVGALVVDDILPLEREGAPLAGVGPADRAANFIVVPVVVSVVVTVTVALDRTIRGAVLPLETAVSVDPPRALRFADAA